jgi:hypothetical protein
MFAGRQERIGLRQRQCEVTRAAATAVILLTVLGVLAAPGLAQTTTTTQTVDPVTGLPANQVAPPANQVVVPVDPVVTTQPPATAPPATTQVEKTARPAVRHEFRSSSTQQLKPEQKQSEQERSCSSKTALATSGMLNLRRGKVVGDQERSDLVLVIGVVLGVVTLALLWWRFHDRFRATESKGVLDVLAVAVAICAGVAALAAQFIPGVGVRDDPPPELTMTVTQVHARVQRGSYARAVAQPVPGRIDRLEIGNVVWLQIGLKGFQGKELQLQWAEYNLDTGGALLPDTKGALEFRVTHDTETRFEPVWVGYPRSGRFQVQVRALENGEVRGMARTGEMRGTQYRYACKASTT